MKKTHILSFLAILLCMPVVLCGCQQGVSPTSGTVSTTTVTTATETTTPSTATTSAAASVFTELTTTTATPTTVATSTTNLTFPTWPAKAAKALAAYKSVLQNNASFLNANTQKPITIQQMLEDYNCTSDCTMKIIEFAVSDLDQDGTPEVCLGKSTNEYADYVEILRYQDGVVYGYEIPSRGFYNLKTDGTFEFSSGAFDGGFGTISFTKSDYSIDEIAYSELSYDADNNFILSYFVDHKRSTMDVFDAAMKKQREKTDIPWYAFTKDNIEAAF